MYCNYKIINLWHTQREHFDLFFLWCATKCTLIYLCLLDGDLFSNRNGDKKSVCMTQRKGSVKKKKKLYQIMPFLWNHGPGKRVSIKEDVSSSWWFQTLGSTGWHHPLSGYVPCWLIKASVSWAQMVWGSLLQPISRLRPVSQSLTMEMITKVQDRGSTITSGVQRGTSNLVTSLPA